MAEWTPKWYRDSETGAIPALEFLASVPKSVRADLLGVVTAVRYVGPVQWRDTTSHRLMRGDLDFMYEARDRLGETLYRLFLIWDRETSTVILVDGRTKPNSTALPDNEYDQLAQVGRAILATNPRPYATEDDMARLFLDRD